MIDNPSETQPMSESPVPNSQVSLDDVPVHKPTILWIGCSDARVPESVMDPTPGQVFVQRNIANQFHLTDSNAVSVVTYGVTGIANNPIQEIRVVGHTHCGGVKACYDAARGNTGGLSRDSVLWTWLGPLRTLAELFVHQPVEALTDENVRVQMRNVRIILSRLDKTHVRVRGFVYELGGQLRELLDIAPSEVGVTVR